MDLKLEKSASPQPVNPETLPLDHPNALAIGRIETTANPRGKPSFSLIPIETRYDLIKQGIGFTVALTNEFGHPEQVQVAYSIPGQTKPEELLRNLEPERLAEISSNPDDPDQLSLLKRLFVKVAAIQSFAEILANDKSLPPHFAQQCDEEIDRLSGLLTLIRQVRASL
ncbi:hypothetical protein [Planctopirus hydrillae]|uniref:Uncharacterized protein n=1 Tax=Planctopirus hydrillae TaxID=1841610 RepID=A0A1C3EIU4_9PLAN|nr:hypothetical protein [Planctopirus hydrillae]ODA33148.1 hypothetical protein A6X21_05120 [Planctopirus hydrillae]